MFFKIGLVSFGGGYAMIPVIEYEVKKHGWLTTQQFTDVVAVAGMAPGPIATNSAVFIGFKTAGFPGAILSTLAISLPSLIIVLLVSLFLYKIQNHQSFQSAFYILRPVITGLITYSAIQFAIHNGIFSLNVDVFGCLIMLGALMTLLFTKTHPVMIIVISGVVGIGLYY